MENLKNSILANFATPEELKKIEEKMAIIIKLQQRRKLKRSIPKSMNRIIRDIEKNYLQAIEDCPTAEELERFDEFLMKNDMLGAEYFFCPEDWNYNTIFDMVYKEDVVYDIGAGDLRFDLMLSKKAKKVYAVEINPTLLANPLRIIGLNMPPNLTVICGNGFKLPLPADVTVITCLMIHRQHEFTAEMKKRRILAAEKEGIVKIEATK